MWNYEGSGVKQNNNNIDSKQTLSIKDRIILMLQKTLCKLKRKSKEVKK